MPTWVMAPLPSNGKLAKIRPPSTLAMVAALSALGLDLTARMSRYPPKKGTADYKRTGTLGRGWTMSGPKIQGQDLVVEVGNAVNYAVKGQDASGLVFGSEKQTQPPELVEDLAKLLPKGVEVFIVDDDLAERGIEPSETIEGLTHVGRGDLPGLFDRFDQVWHW